jgi:tripartite ATP-independent transporter DctP family solute receptor
MKSVFRPRFFAVLLMLIFASVYCFAGGGQEGETTGKAAETVVLKLGHIDTPTSPMGMGADKFKELVEARTNGQIEVQVFPSEQLGKAAAMVEDLIAGALELYLENPGTFDQYVPAQKIHFVQYYFRSREHLRNCTQSELWNEAFIKPMEAVGVKTLGTKWTWDRGPIRCIIATKPIITPDDLKDVKLRLWPSDAAIAVWQTLGASTVVMAWSEVYLGLKTGTVNAVTASGATIYPNKFTEVAKYVSMLDQQQQTINLHMNKALFDGLPADLQQILIDAANEAGVYFTSLVNGNWESDVEKMKSEHGAQFFTPDTAPWIEKAKPVIFELEEKDMLPKGLFAQFQKIPG